MAPKKQKVENTAEANLPKDVLAMNLSKLMRESHIKPKELSHHLNISTSTINSILYSQSSNPRLSTLESLADYFSVSIDQLTGKMPLNLDRPSGTFNPDIIHVKKIPLLNLNEVKLWIDDGIGNDQINAGQTVVTQENVSEKAFAVNMIGESMKPRFHEGNILIMEPAIAPKNQDIVLVLFDKQEVPIFRQIFFDGNDTFFKPLNPEFGHMILSKDHKILGVMVSAYINR